MKDALFLGIDTSNYTTSVAVAGTGADGCPAVLANLKLPLPVEAGERGLRQSDAVFTHVRGLPELLSEARGVLAAGRLTAVGYSGFPRDCKGSYMPCFLPGRAAAAAAAAATGVPLYQYSHQAGHVRAAVFSSAMPLVPGEKFIAFHVSGGTTEVLCVTAEQNGYAVKRFGGTADISAGQAIDRIGVMLGMHFPCGRELESAAEEFRGVLPKTKISVNGLECNLSGLENMARRLYEAGADASAVSALTLDFLGRTLQALTASARVVMPGAKVLYSGGVMSNRRLGEMLAAYGAYFAAPAFSADNAAGIALLTMDRYAAEGGE